MRESVARDGMVKRREASPAGYQETIPPKEKWRRRNRPQMFRSKKRRPQETRLLSISINFPPTHGPLKCHLPD